MAAESILGPLNLEATQQQLLSGLTALTAIKQAGLTPGGAQRIGTTRSRFREEFITYDDVNTWRTIQTGAGQSIAPAGVAGGSRYLNIASGTNAGAETIIISRETFRFPLRFVIGASMSQRIAGTEAYFELVEVDQNGDPVLATSPFTSPSFEDAANGVAFKFDGTTVNNGMYAVRGQGISEFLSSSVAMGTAPMTATGTGPNFFASYMLEMMLKTDMLSLGARAVNSAAAASSIINKTDYLPDPTANYAIRIRVKNVSAPATSTDVRIHFLRVLDTSSVAVNFDLIAGNPTDAQAAPVKVIGTVPVNGSLTTAGTATPLPSTTAGGFASFLKLTSAATTNLTAWRAAATALSFLTAYNGGAAVAYLKLYNKATAPVLATDVPVMKIPLPPNQLVVLPFHFARFSTGLALAITNLEPDTDATTVAAGQVVLSAGYL